MKLLGGSIIEQLTIDPSLAFNRKATADRAHKFLTNDFERWLNQCGATKADLQSPKWDQQPKGRSISNSQEEKLMRILIARHNVETIRRAIYNCKADNADLLIKRYLEEQADVHVMQRLGFESTQYYKHRSAALCEFAERLEFWSAVEDAELPNLITGKLPDNHRRKSGQKADDHRRLHEV